MFVMKKMLNKDPNERTDAIELSKFPIFSYRNLAETQKDLKQALALGISLYESVLKFGNEVKFKGAESFLEYESTSEEDSSSSSDDDEV